MSGGSLRTRLMVWNVAIVAVLTVGLGLVVSWRVQTDLMTGVDRELRERSMRNMGLPGMGPGQVPGPPPDFRGQPRRGPDGQRPYDGQGPPQGQGFEGQNPGGQGPMDSPFQRFGPPPGMPMESGRVFIAQGSFRPRVFDAKQKSISQFRDDEPWDKAAAIQVSGKGGPDLMTTTVWQGEDHRVLTRPLPGEPPGRIVQYATPLAETRRAIAGLNQTLLALLPFALFIAGLGGYYLTDRALKPVKRIAQIAERISGENLSERLPVQGQDEFAQLAGTINATLDRLEEAFRSLSEAFERQQRFTADASHELKTPLTAIKAQTSLALTSERGAAEYREAIVAVDRSATRMGELIEDLLVLARADAGKMAGEPETIDWAALLESAAREAIPMGGPTFRLELTPKMPPFVGSSAALGRLFTNLLSNAARHTPAEGSITVRSKFGGGRLIFEVVDSGEGIASEHLAHLGERFYRVDSARARAQGGVGLGLAICRRIAEAHGGSLEFESEPGLGTTVWLNLPAAPPNP